MKVTRNEVTNHVTKGNVFLEGFKVTTLVYGVL